MRRLIILFGVLFCGAAYAATETINWFVDGGVYATTTCESGGDITLPPTPTKYGYTFHGWSAYKRLEYIESTGTQYIDLSFGFNAADEIETQISIDISEGTERDKAMLSPIVWNDDKNRFSFGVFASKFTIGFGNQETTSTILQPDTKNDGNLHTWYYGDRTVSIPDVNAELDLQNITFGGTTQNLRLFYGVRAPTKGKIAYYKHKRNGFLIGDLIPVLDPEGTACMYDLVEQKYYYNAGTGDFIAGPVVGE